MIYEIKGYHHKRAYIKGDLEAEDVLECSESFPTRKAANDYLKKKDTYHRRCGHKTNFKLVGRGDNMSTLYAYTGDTWIHENSGEEEHEIYYYKMIKK